MSVNVRALRDEASWLPRTLGETTVARRALLAAGQPPAVADAIVGWLVAKAVGDPDLTAAPTRARYRKILRNLEAPGPDSLNRTIPGLFNQAA